MAEEARRWGGLALAMWLMLFSGSYSLSNYTSALKDVLDLNQKQLNALSVAKDLGDAIGIIAGVLSTRIPPPALLCIGAIVAVAGYGLQWLVVSAIIDPLPFPAMFVASMLSGNAISWMNASVFTVSVQNFPRNRGPVTGVLKAYMGLSAAFYSTLSDRFFPDSSSMYLLMLFVLVPSFTLISAAFIRRAPPPSPTARSDKLERGAVVGFTTVACALAGYIILQEVLPGLSEGGMVSLLFVLVAAPVVVGAGVAVVAKARKTKEEELEEEESRLKKPLMVTEEVHVAAEEAVRAAEVEEKIRGCCPAVQQELGTDLPTLTMLSRWHYYVLYVALFCSAGSGMAFVNNLGQIALSFGYSSATNFTSLFSLGNFLGRVMSGHLSELSLRRFATPRPFWMGLSKLLMMAMFSWLSLGQMDASLYLGSFLIGLCHGSLISLTIPTVSELYGIHFFATNFMVTNTHLLVGSYVLSGLLAGYLYDLHASPDTLDCYGSSCYGTTFIIYCILLVFALFLDALLTFLSGSLYRKLRMINTLHIPKEAPSKAP